MHRYTLGSTRAGYLLKALSILVSLTLFVSAPARPATIAVLDSGVDITLIPGLAPYISPNGIDVLNGGAPVDTDGHGTVVSAVAVLSSDLSARILPIKLPFPLSSPTLNSFAVNYAAADPAVRILNLSWLNTVFDVTTLHALKAAAAKGKIIVMSAGNTAAVNPDFPAGTAGQLGGRGLAVGAVDENNVLRPYSARAGSTREHYVVAPDDAFGAGLRGTSFSAPYVAGLASLILDQAPFLSAEDVVAIILRTSIDLGVPGVDAVYGHGLVNGAAALSPVGASRIPSGSTLEGTSIPFTTAALTVSPAFGYALFDRADELGSALVLDEYHRPFSVDLSQLIDIRENRASLPFLLASRASSHSPLPLGQSLFHARLAVPADEFDGFDHAETGLAEIAFSLHGDLTDRIALGFTNNELAGLGLGTAALDGYTTRQSFTTDVFSAPFATFDSVADSAAVSIRLSDRFGVNFSLVNVDNGEDRYGTRSTAGVLEATYRASERLTLQLQAGETIEQGTLYGGVNHGLFSVDTAQTTSLGGGMRWDLGPDFTLLAQYNQGITRVSDTGTSLLSDLDTISSSSYGVALLGRNTLRRGDRLGLALYKPLRVNKGAARLRVPSGRDMAGNILSSDERVSLVPTSSETDLELSYRAPITGNWQFDGQLLYQHHPFHTDSVSDRFTAYARVSLSW